MSSTLLCVDISCQIVVVTSVFRELQNHKTLFRRKASLIVFMASQSLGLISLLKTDRTSNSPFLPEKRKSENNEFGKCLSSPESTDVGTGRVLQRRGGMEEKRQRAGQKEECFCYHRRQAWHRAVGELLRLCLSMA